MVTMKKYFLYIIVLNYIFCIGAFSQVTVVEDSLFSRSINRTSKFYVILPDGYSKNQERYPSVYLLHGFNGDYTNWVKQSELVKYLKEYHFIVVTPDAKNSWYTNSVTQKDMNYEDLIIKDLIPYVDKKYRTLQSKFDRAVAGLSMGGYGAAKFGLKYPNLFFFAGCLSPAIQFPAGLEDSAIVARRSKASNESVREMFGAKRNTHWSENDIFSLVDKCSPTTAPFFYIAVGSQDGIPEIIDLSHSFAAALRKKDIPYEMHESAGAHEWRFWDKEIEIVLQRINAINGKKN
jgi:putative tributyrin esterase